MPPTDPAPAPLTDAEIEELRRLVATADRLAPGGRPLEYQGVAAIDDLRRALYRHRHALLAAAEAAARLRLAVKMLASYQDGELVDNWQDTPDLIVNQWAYHAAGLAAPAPGGAEGEGGGS